MSARVGSSVARGRAARALGIMLAVACALVAARPAAADRVLRTEVIVPAPVSDVWKAWTTGEGIATFFAPQGKVDLRVDGTYDVWFLPQAEPGLRGADGMRILDIEKEKRFAFTWNAPPSIPAIRGRRTMVVLEFESAGTRSTRLRFTQLGWGEGAEWDKAYDYFDRAWGAIVLPFLVRRFEEGPIDWKKPPKMLTTWPTLKRTLSENPS